MPKTKRAPPAKELSWSVVRNPEAAYASCVDGLAHYSAKTINSKAAAVGVRLAANERFDGPYVAVSTVGPANVPVDYVRGANPDAKLLKQILGVLKPSERLAFAAIPGDEAQLIRQLEPRLNARAEVGTDWVDARLRQVLVPVSSAAHPSDYVALTPLNAAGLVALINARLEEEIARAKAADIEPRYRRRTRMGFGGSNPQNVGRLVGELQRPLLFDPPTPNPEIRRAQALFYKGLDVPGRLRDVFNAYALWRHALMQTHGGRMPSTLESRTEEARLVQAIARAILREAARATALLREQVNPDAQTLSSAQLPDTMRALLDPALRDRHFPGAFSRWVAQCIDHHQYMAPATGELVRVSLGDDEAARLAPLMQELVR